MSYSPRYLKLTLALLFVLAIAITGGKLQGLNDREGCRDYDAFMDFAPFASEIQNRPEGANDRKRLRGNIRIADASFEFVVMRSFGLPSAVISPASILGSKWDPDRSRVVYVGEDDDQMAVVFTHAESGVARQMAVYVYLYSGRSIQSPFAQRIMEAPSALWNGSAPIDLVMVSGAVRRGKVDRVEREILDWMQRLWTHYRATCRD
jgi:hypothetical protein